MDTQAMQTLALRYAKERTESALAAALEAALPLCRAIVARFSGRGVEQDDLYQVASLACVSALRAFEPERGLMFTTYATPTITGTVRNYLRDKAQGMRTPRGVREQLAVLDKTSERLSQTLGREPSVREVAQEMNMDVARALDLLASRERARLTPIDDEAMQVGFHEKGYAAFEAREDVRGAMTRLTEQERRLLALRYDRQLSQREIARMLDMSQMQVSRMERRTLDKLRQDLEGEGA